MHGDSQPPFDDSPQAIAKRHRTTWVLLGAVVAVLVLILAAYQFFSRPGPLPGTGATLSARELTAVMQPITGRLESIGVDGKSKFAGLAVTIAEGEMVTTCHSLPPGGELQVVFPDGKTHAESVRVNRALDICVLKVRTTGPHTAKVRVGEPTNEEKVYVASITDPKVPIKLVQTRVANPIAEAGGAALKLETREIFASGAPVFDTQGRLAGIITFPHQYGDVTIALSTSRIDAVRSKK